MLPGGNGKPGRFVRKPGGKLRPAKRLLAERRLLEAMKFVADFTRLLIIAICRAISGGIESPRGGRNWGGGGRFVIPSLRFNVISNSRRNPSAPMDSISSILSMTLV